MQLRTVFAIFLITSFTALAQSGMRFEDFKEKLDPYFAEELISDIEKEMPQRNYTIWGYGVGDFSGDGFYDVAFSTRVYSDRGRIMRVYMFADIDGFLVKVGEFRHKYVELPLEVGVIVRDNTCFITRKNKLYNWDIIGYRFYNGAISLVDTYRTERIGRYTKESFVNYQNMERRAKYFRTSNKDVKFQVKYSALPCYNLHQIIYNGYGESFFAGDIDYVPLGAYDWHGTKDGSFRIESKYDEDYLYFNLSVIDSIPAVSGCPTCLNDHLDLWFDFNEYENSTSRFLDENRGRMTINQIPEDSVYSLKFDIGNFLEKRGSLQSFGSAKTPAPYQAEALKGVRIITNLKDSVSYDISIKIPFLVFGLGPPVGMDEIKEIGFTAVFNDVDNMFREIEASMVATSAFDSKDPKTYGSLLFIPEGKWYGESENIYKERILEEISKFGF